MQFVLVDDVTLKAVEIVFGEQLSREEAWTAETFETTANRTTGDGGLSSGNDGHKILLTDSSTTVYMLNALEA